MSRAMNLTPANNGHLRERQNMREAARHRRESGDWKVLADLPRGRTVVAASGYETEEDAEEAKEALENSETAGYQNSDLRVVEKTRN